MRIDLVIRKEGGEWCLYTSDGARKLGCHPTEDEAKAQEAAIKAREGLAARHVLGALRVADRQHAIADLALALDHSEGDEGIALGREFIRLGAEAFIVRMGCDGIAKMFESFGGSFTDCEAKADFASDPEAFCGALKAAARDCGLSGTGKLGADSGKSMVLFDSRIDTSLATELEDGSARMEVLLAPEGKAYTNGGDSFNVSRADIDAAIRNYEARGGPIPGTIGHYPDGERQKQPAALWIENVYRKVKDGKAYLGAVVRFLRDTWTRIKSDEFKFLSMEFWPSDKDQHGEEIGMNLDGVAVLNYPFFPLRFDQAHAGGGKMLILCAFGGQGGLSMDGKQNKDGKPGDDGDNKKDEKIQVDKVELAKLKTDSEELSKLKASKAGGEDEAVALRKRVDDLEKKDAASQLALKARRIRDAVTLLTEQRGVHIPLGDHKIDTDEGAIKFLDSMPLGVSTVEGLEKLAADAEAAARLPHVKLGGEVPAGDGKATLAGRVDLGTEQGRAEAVRLRVAELRKTFPGAEFEHTLGRRHQTIEEYARQELHNEHPKAGFLQAEKKTA